MKIPFRQVLAFALMAGSGSALGQESAAPAAPAPQAAAAEQAPAEKAPAEKPKTGLVVTSEDASARCMLPLVVTAVDGKPIAEGQPSDQFEFEPGEHSLSGYGAGDPGKCATFAADGGLPIPEGGQVGESTLKLNVEAGKEYYLAMDVRSKDKSHWRVVVWKLNH
jgi:hypothetical protein